MPDGYETLWGETDPPVLPKRRSWRMELVGVGLLVLGVLCGCLGYELGGSRIVILVVIGIGMAIMASGSFLISWGGGSRVLASVGSALITFLLLAGVAVLILPLYLWPEDPASQDSGPVWIRAAVGIGCIVIGLIFASGRLGHPWHTSSSLTYRQLKAEDEEREIKECQGRSETVEHWQDL